MPSMVLKPVFSELDSSLARIIRSRASKTITIGCEIDSPENRRFLLASDERALFLLDLRIRL